MLRAGRPHGTLCGLAAQTVQRQWDLLLGLGLAAPRSYPWGRALAQPLHPSPLWELLHHLANQRRAQAAASVSQQDLKAPWGQGSRMTDEL